MNVRIVASLFTLAVTAVKCLPIDHVRKLQANERAALKEELDAWKASAAARDAEELGVRSFLGASMHENTVVSLEEEELARFFQTKMRIQALQREHPHAEFSTDSPFTLLTDHEFHFFVMRSGLHSSAEAERKLAKEEREFHFFSNGTGPHSSGEADRKLAKEEREFHFFSNGTGPHSSDEADRKLAKEDATPMLVDDDAELPVAVDWSQSGCLTPVKNQGSCGSCAYFAATAAIEVTQCMYQNGHPKLYSEQRSVSCFGGGCNGEWPRHIFQFMKEEGLCLSDDYPYTSGTTKVSGECKLNSCRPEMPRIQQVVRVNTNEKSLKAAMVNRPVVVMVAAGNSVWKQYKRGVIETCGDATMDHAVLAVAYAEDANGKYWNLKNSWGSSWGDNGYVRLRRDVADPEGTCRIVQFPPVYADYH